MHLRRAAFASAHRPTHRPAGPAQPAVRRAALAAALAAVLASLILGGRGAADDAQHAASAPVVIEGSSTVYPISVAVSERVTTLHPQLISQVVCSGSSAGLRRLISGDIPIADASRPINKEEIAKAQANGISYIELPVALDALTFVVNRRNSFVNALTVDELRRLLRPDSDITTWAQIRSGWPDTPIEIFSMGKDSGTFDYMTEVIVGKARAIRSDLAGTSQDPQNLINEVVKRENAIAYFGYAYFRQNESMLKAVAIDGGNGPVAPSVEAIVNGSYRPLSRPIFIYVSTAALARPEVVTYVENYLHLAPVMAEAVGYQPLSPHVYDLVRQRFERRITGSVFSSATPASRFEELLGEDAGAQERQDASTATTSATPGAAGSASPVANRWLAPTPAPAAAATTSAAASPSPAWSGPSPADYHRRLAELRDLTLACARAALDDGTPLASLARQQQEAAQRAAQLVADFSTAPHAAGQDLTIGDATALIDERAPDAQAFAALIGRLALTDQARGLMDDPALRSFQAAALHLSDAQSRARLASALMHRTAEHLPEFIEVVSSFGRGHADLDLVLCYERGGLAVR